MTDSIQTTPAAASPAKPKRRKGLLIAGAVAAALTGAAATAAIGASGYGPGFGHGFGPGFGPGHFRHGGFMGRLDPAQIVDRADRGVRHMAIEIDANAEQQEKLRGIVKSALTDLLPMRDRAAAARERARSLLTQGTVDRAAIESFRAEQIAQVDAASKRLTQALVDAAEVLSPEQRQQIAERFSERRHGFSRSR